MKAELIHELVTADVIATSSAYATRAHIVDLFNQLSAATARAEAAEGRADGLYRALCEAVKASGGIAREGLSDEFLILGVPAEMAARKKAQEVAESTVAGLRRALEAGKADRWAATVGNTETNAFAPSPWVLMAETALAASPDDHARKLKAEALHWWFDEDHEPEREAVRIKREEAGVRWTSDQWIAAVRDAMEKEVNRS